MKISDKLNNAKRSLAGAKQETAPAPKQWYLDGAFVDACSGILQARKELEKQIKADSTLPSTLPCLHIEIDWAVRQSHKVGRPLEITISQTDADRALSILERLVKMKADLACPQS